MTRIDLIFTVLTIVWHCLALFGTVWYFLPKGWVAGRSYLRVNLRVNLRVSEGHLGTAKGGPWTAKRAPEACRAGVGGPGAGIPAWLGPGNTHPVYPPVYTPLPRVHPSHHGCRGRGVPVTLTSTLSSFYQNDVYWTTDLPKRPSGAYFTSGRPPSGRYNLPSLCQNVPSFLIER